MTMNLKQFTAVYRNRINEVLTQVLPAENIEPDELSNSMHYMMLGNGKRIRPLLVYASGIAFNAEIKDLDKIAASVELIHVYSLIHDDLPAMDNDDLRHGKPSCHKQFNEAIAILCGDALQSLAFDILSGEFIAVKTKTQLALINNLAQAIGTKGMVAGQVLDINAEGKKISQTELEKIHRNKTGALITASIHMGSLAGQQISATQLAFLQEFAQYLGLMFQIKDDILDIEGTTEKLGKKQGADIALNKATYPSIIGMEKAKQLLSDYYIKAIEALEKTKVDAQLLQQITQFIVERDH